MRQSEPSWIVLGANGVFVSPMLVSPTDLLSLPMYPVRRFVSDFIPHPWLPTGHLQTIAAGYAPTPRIPFQTVPHRLVLSGGDITFLHEDAPFRWEASGPIALLVHGLTGSHQSPYLVRMVAKLVTRGWRTFRLDLRGCGASAGLARQFGHAGRSEDVAAAVETITSWYPQAKLSVIGFSLGGNLVLKMLGEMGATCPTQLHRAAAVSPPIDLTACINYLERGFRSIYSLNFVNRLVREIRRRSFQDPTLSVSLQPRPKWLSEFDDRITAPLSGFRDGPEYYRLASPAPLLPSIAVSTLLVTAADDPMIPPSIFEQAHVNPAIKLEITSRGGHMGYISTTRHTPDGWWIDWRLLDWLQSDLAGSGA